jgi:hypothetical protein
LPNTKKFIKPPKPKPRAKQTNSRKSKSFCPRVQQWNIDRDTLKQKLIDTIEIDFVANKVTEKEQEIVEKVQKTKEDEIRDRLAFIYSHYTYVYYGKCF